MPTEESLVQEIQRLCGKGMPAAQQLSIDGWLHFFGTVKAERGKDTVEFLIRRVYAAAE